MKRVVSIFILVWFLMCANAGVRTYQFVSASWGSKTLGGTCDQQTDGWTCDKAAYDYAAGYINAAGQPYSAGVGVTTGTSNAGATSILSFTGVTEVAFNYCQNSSKGRGAIYVQVGNNPADSIVITKPASGTGTINRDTTLVLSASYDGQVKFWVRCTENRITIASITITATAAGDSQQTDYVYRRVHSTSELQDGDIVVLACPSQGMLMGYYDETVSRNNIHAKRCTFAQGGEICYANEDAWYSLEVSTLNGQTVYAFRNEAYIDDWYLVATGGNPSNGDNNYLTEWNHCYDEKAYGNYGYWSISFAGDSAIICNQGNSRSRYIQYNPNKANSKPLFGCYPSPYLFGPHIYRLSEEPLLSTPVEEVKIEDIEQSNSSHTKVEKLLHHGRLYLRRNNQIINLY